ncbi:MAG: succinate dehydrogenase, hydrophobic membrane anchor protein [Rhodospirillaceae bacterium]|nr:succinate dehydrogenase, hydrophobic membrane anchor protein [Rhodospirillaceae bacterium]
MDMRTPLAQARGLGPAKSGGTSHWWAQRLTSLALVPLMLWFVVAVISLIGADHGAFVAWVSEPGTLLLLVLTIISLFYHLDQGMQVVVEDYIHGEAAKLTVLIAVKGFSYIGGIASPLAVLRVAFGS